MPEHELLSGSPMVGVDLREPNPADPASEPAWLIVTPERLGHREQGSPGQRKSTYSRAAATISSKASGAPPGHRDFVYSRTHRSWTGVGKECVNETRSISPGATAVDCQSKGRLVLFW